MKEEKEKKLFMVGMSILLVLVLVIGGTYAWFTLQLKGTKVNVLKAGTLSLILNDENSIGIKQEKAVPTLDEVGEKLDPYHFTLENHSDMPSEYTIYLDDMELEDGEVRMADNKVKYSFVKDEGKTTALLSTTGSHPNRILDSGTIEAGQTITYDLRLWIDSNAGNEVMGQVVKTKIRVVALQTEPSDNRNENILAIYQYDATNCLTGEESTCVELEKAPSTYEVGTIIKYQVNDMEEKYFHVISDNNDGTLTLQQRENTINAVKWYDVSNDNTKGPLTVLPLLESATKDWTNVNDQTYAMGTKVFNTNAFTGCDYDSTTKEISCTMNTYSLPERTAKARMITAQEVALLGCKFEEDRSCPAWMNNYLYESTNYGGTVDGTDYGYWTMSAHSTTATNVMFVGCRGRVVQNGTVNLASGARAVVVINKK